MTISSASHTLATSLLVSSLSFIKLLIITLFAYFGNPSNDSIGL